MSFHPEFGRYSESEMAHEAAFDAFMTGTTIVNVFGFATGHDDSAQHCETQRTKVAVVGPIILDFFVCCLMFSMSLMPFDAFGAC